MGRPVILWHGSQSPTLEAWGTRTRGGREMAKVSGEATADETSAATCYLRGDSPCLS
jgi:hypothetical protein